MTLFEAYCWVAGAGVVLLLLVAQKAGHDKACMADPWHLRWLRRSTFYAGALIMLYTIASRMSPLSMLLVACGLVYFLTINWVVLHLRPKPQIPTAAAMETSAVYDIAARARRRAF